MYVSLSSSRRLSNNDLKPLVHTDFNCMYPLIRKTAEFPIFISGEYCWANFHVRIDWEMCWFLFPAD